jgi:hypothetical protein
MPAASPVPAEPVAPVHVVQPARASEGRLKKKKKKNKRLKKNKKEKKQGGRRDGRKTSAAVASSSASANTTELPPLGSEEICEKKKKNTQHPPEPISLCRDPGVRRRFLEAKACQLRDSALALWFIAYQISEPLIGVAQQCHLEILKFLHHDRLNHGCFAWSTWPGILMAAFPGLHCSPELDKMLLSVVLMTYRNRGHQVGQLLDFIEYSSGSAMLTLMGLLAGFHGVALDKDNYAAQDNTCPAGLRLWFNQLTATRAGALVWFGTECSSFSCMCLHSSGRAESNWHLGNEADFVAKGNFQMQLTAVLYFLAPLLCRQFWITCSATG